MNNIIGEQEASACEPRLAESLFEICRRLSLIPIPLKLRSKVPLVRWSDESWRPALLELEAWGSKPDTNWGVRCGSELAALDFDTADTFHGFLQTHPEAASWPRVKTGRGFHIWLKPKKPVRSQRISGLEIKCLGSYVVVPPSIHPSGVRYVFEVTPDGALPEVDLEELLSLGQEDANSQPGEHKPMQENAPSDFALRYGKSPYPASLCGLATKVLTRSDGKVKKLVSLRCWKWHCRKCAPLLRRYWVGKLSSLSFRFIIRLPTVAKPTVFLRHLGKPDYAHIVANGESWLFLTDGDTDKVWHEAQKADYQLIAGDVSGDPSQDEIRQCLEQALCAEDEPLNTRRKVTHSRGVFRKQCPSNEHDESKRKDGCPEEDRKGMSAEPGKDQLPWNSEVVMKPIEELATELELDGWHVLWTSEVEAIAIRGKAVEGKDTDIVELMESLGIKLKKAGQEYVGLCPFHDDHNPSLSVNREKGLWHCFGCGRGGDSQAFVKEWQTLRR